MMLKLNNLTKVSFRNEDIVLLDNSCLPLELLKAREDMETLRGQYDKSIQQYDELSDENRKLQVNSTRHIDYLLFSSCLVF